MQNCSKEGGKLSDRQNEFSGAGAVREGYEIDIPSLQSYMSQNVKGFEGPLEVRQFKGGQSNPTYLLLTPGKKYVLRRKPPGTLLKSAHAVDREYRVIKTLQETDIPVAKPYALCLDDTVIGTWFYIMDYVEGRVFWSYDSMPEADRKDIYFAMNEIQARLHSLDYRQLGLGDYGKPGNYFERQISRWTKQYEASKDKPYTAMEKLIDWLKANIPENDETSLVHGDFRLDNMIIHPTENRILAIIDWELSTLGHPLSDFAYSCLPWYSPQAMFNGFSDVDKAAHNLPTEREFIEAYCRNTGRSGIENWNYYMAFNFFRLAAIIFGIKGRIRDGTAASAKAKETARLAVPLSELGLEQTGS